MGGPFFTVRYNGDMPAWLIVILFCLAVHRASRFIGVDTFPPIAALRHRITARAQTKYRVAEDGSVQPHWLVYLIGNNVDSGCPWCISLWLGGIGSLALGIFDHEWPWWGYVMLWLSSSTVTGLINELED